MIETALLWLDIQVQPSLLLLRCGRGIRRGDVLLDASQRRDEQLVAQWTRRRRNCGASAASRGGSVERLGHRVRHKAGAGRGGLAGSEDHGPGLHGREDGSGRGGGGSRRLGCARSGRRTPFPSASGRFRKGFKGGGRVRGRPDGPGELLGLCVELARDGDGRLVRLLHVHPVGQGRPLQEFLLLLETLLDPLAHDVPSLLLIQRLVASRQAPLAGRERVPVLVKEAGRAHVQTLVDGQRGVRVRLLQAGRRDGHGLLLVLPAARRRCRHGQGGGPVLARMAHDRRAAVDAQDEFAPGGGRPGVRHPLGRLVQPARGVLGQTPPAAGHRARGTVKVCGFPNTFGDEGGGSGEPGLGLFVQDGPAARRGGWR